VRQAEHGQHNPLAPVLVIVNADDLGMSRQVNEAIFSLMERGRLTSASLLANAPATDEAIQRLSQFPHCSFGAHLNFTEYEPLSNCPDLNELLDGDGKFRPLPAGFRFNVRKLRAIHTELKTQIEKLLGQGVALTHLDSHMNVHLRPSLFPVIKSLQQAYRIRIIRIKENLDHSPERVRLKTKIRRFVFNWAMRRVSSSVTVDAATELATFISIASRQTPTYETVEASAHPGNPYYPHDTELLLSPWEKQLSFPVRLASFHQLV
jgi:predicted glycoside hydrolase/deacetylase ChbG (UPF0249 family)